MDKHTSRENTVSIVVPCFNEEESLHAFMGEVNKAALAVKKLYDLDVEYWFVDDGSIDGTLDLVRQFAQQSESVHYLSFSRNFGKEAALYAGLTASCGAYVITMDADLQDPPSLIPNMLGFLSQNPDYDCVATRRANRTGEPPVRSALSRLFYRLINRISTAQIVDGARDYRCMTRKFVDAVLSLGEINRFSKGIFSWVGFKTHWISYENIERVAGRTKWSLLSLFRYSIEGIVDFSTAPLVLASYTGLFFCFAAFAGIVFVVARALLFGDPVAGWPSTICVILLIGGIQLFSLGILGEYLSKTYLETKRRPIYVVAERK